MSFSTLAGGKVFLEALYHEGIGVTELRALQDARVLTAVAANQEARDRFVRATSLWTGGVSVPPPPTDVSWPLWISCHFGERAEPLWEAPPHQLHWQQEMRSIACRHHKGELVYPRSLAEEGNLRAEVIAFHKIGREIGMVEDFNPIRQVLRWLGVQLLPPNEIVRWFNPAWVGFENVYEGKCQPGDLWMFYETDPIHHPAVLTKVDADGEALEVLLPWHGHLYLAHPDLAGRRKTIWRPKYSPPAFLIPDLIPATEDIQPLRMTELKFVEKHLSFEPSAYRILFRHGGAVPEDKWYSFVSLANGDNIQFWFSIKGKKKQERLVATVSYHQSVATDPPDFVEAIEAGLLDVARQLAIPQLHISYRLGTNKDQQIRMLRGKSYQVERGPYRVERSAKLILLTSSPAATAQPRSSCRVARGGPRPG